MRWTSKRKARVGRLATARVRQLCTSSSARVAGKGARVAPQAGKFSFKEARDVGHGIHPLMRGHSPRSRLVKL